MCRRIIMTDTLTRLCPSLIIESRIQDPIAIQSSPNDSEAIERVCIGLRLLLLLLPLYAVAVKGTSCLSLASPTNCMTDTLTFFLSRLIQHSLIVI